jgi:HAD superfamily hydrolase (TIGR01509 family)
MAVCSNKPVSMTKRLLDALAISRYFDAAYGPEDAGKPKPDPAMIQLALRRLGILPSHAVYVGDMPVDVETARNAGVTVFVLPTGSSDLESLTNVRPDRIFQTMAEIPPVVLGVVS